MKSLLKWIALALLLVQLLVAPTPCFAIWDVLAVSKTEASKHGLEIRSKAAGADRVSVELEFKPEGAFKAFGPDAKFKDRASVQLWIGEGDNLELTAVLREDRSKEGRVSVHFTADRAKVAQIRLMVMAPYTDGAQGGAQYRLQVKDFIDAK